jgi:hypothetical protein
MAETKFEVSEYVTGKLKDISYGDMSRYNLSSEQVREIAIARADARKKYDEEVITMKVNTI